MTQRTGRNRVFVKREAAQARAYSQAVITEGGRAVWLAGQVGAADASGKSLAGDFDGQVREVFSRLGRTLEGAGGSLADMVTNDRVHHRRPLRRPLYPTAKGNLRR